MTMRQDEKAAIDNMRIDGMKPPAIAAALGLSVNTVYTYIRRHPELPNARTCLYCGKPVLQPHGKRVKKFCSSSCRMAWWNSHQDQVKRKAYYKLVCQFCGKEFESYGNKNRKYCCRTCYIADLRKRSLQL